MTTLAPATASAAGISFANGRRLRLLGLALLLAAACVLPFVTLVRAMKRQPLMVAWPGLLICTSYCA